MDSKLLWGSSFALPLDAAASCRGRRWCQAQVDLARGWNSGKICKICKIWKNKKATKGTGNCKKCSFSQGDFNPLSTEQSSHLTFKATCWLKLTTLGWLAVNSWDPARRIITSIPTSHPSQTSISTSAIGIMPGTWAGCTSIADEPWRKVDLMVTRYWYQTLVVQSCEKYGAVSIMCKTGKKITPWSKASWNHLVELRRRSPCGFELVVQPWNVSLETSGRPVEWKLMRKNSNETITDNNCWRTLEFLLCPFRSRLQTLIFRLEWAFPRFTAHWLPLEQLCGHQSLPTTQWPSTEIVTSSWRDSASWKANLDANLPGFGYKFLGLVGVDVEQQNIQGFLMNLQSI